MGTENPALFPPGYAGGGYWRAPPTELAKDWLGSGKMSGLALEYVGAAE